VGPTLLEIAEAPAAFVVPRHPLVVHGEGFVFSQMGPDTGAVQRIRLAADRLKEAREAVRAIAAERGLASVGWWVSPLTEPADPGARLGLERTETLAALGLTSPPNAGGDVEVREVRTLEDFSAAQDLDATVNGWPLAPREKQAEAWSRLGDRFLLWLALEDGRPVGMGRCAVSEHALMMIGGAVLPEARGRGVYRSLVAARWRTAVERGLPALVTTANHNSRPILERLGFERLGDVEIWIDRLS
jgi:GNAT superfamily N-acetyltransferase